MSANRTIPEGGAAPGGTPAGHVAAAGWRELSAGITAPEGFLASGVHCGIRKSRPDLALIVASGRAAAAGVFTTHRLPAPPVVLARELLERTGGRTSAIIVNSGNANACTGPAGMDAARAMVRETARVLGVPEDEVLVASTGVIGVPLPIGTVLSGIPRVVAGLSRCGSHAAAEAILTTDTRTKQTAVEVTCSGGRFRVGGIAKGSGMIHPDMATTLAFVTTDAPIAPPALREALRASADRTFNRITVDGDTSTNDAILVLARGREDLDPAAFSPGSAGGEAFSRALEEVLRRLARMVVADGEGATRVMEVVVRQAAHEEEAARAARAIARSSLVKTALHGADANWGRIAGAVGAAGVSLDPDALSVTIAGLPVLRPGYVIELDEEEAARRLSAEEIVIEVELGAGAAEARAWGCDLSAEYVRINADYRT